VFSCFFLFFFLKMTQKIRVLCHLAMDCSRVFATDTLHYAEDPTGIRFANDSYAYAKMRFTHL